MNRFDFGDRWETLKAAIQPRHYYIGGGIAIVLIICLVIIFLVPGTSKPETSADKQATQNPEPTTTAEPTTAETPSTPGTKSDSICGLTTVAESAEISEPFINKQQHISALRYYSFSDDAGLSSHGPMIATDIFPSCYAQTPQGAVLTALNVLAASIKKDTSLASLNNFVSTSKDALVSEIETANFKDTNDEITAFEVVEYSPEISKIAVGGIIQQYNQSSYFYFVFSLVWEDGDWKVVPSQDLEMVQSTTMISADRLHRMNSIKDYTK